MIEVEKGEKETDIEHGFVVSLDGTGEQLFMFVAWKHSGSKWHQHKEECNPS